MRKRSARTAWVAERWVGAASLAVSLPFPVLYSIGSATPALAATAARPGSVPTATDDLVRGVERRYNAPLLTPGTRLVLPAGIKAVPVQDYYRRPHLASAASAWPYMRATDGTTVDASIVPERGAPTRIAILSGFTEGWYELIHASGRADRVTWDAGKLPVPLGLRRVRRHEGELRTATGSTRSRCSRFPAIRTPAAPPIL